MVNPVSDESVLQTLLEMLLENDNNDHWLRAIGEIVERGVSTETLEDLGPILPFLVSRKER